MLYLRLYDITDAQKFIDMAIHTYVYELSVAVIKNWCDQTS